MGGRVNQLSQKSPQGTKHVEVHQVRQCARVSAVVSILAQIQTPQRLRPGVELAGARDVAGGKPSGVLVSAQFISFIPVELLLGRFAQELCHGRS